MATASSNNVIKISSDNSSFSSDTNVDIKYPRVCDFCRDTYNTELTFRRHKETGKCFRFCRLREEMPDKFKKNKKPPLYPRRCERCLKIYKNKHSFCKHKHRCWGVKKNSLIISNTDDKASLPSTSQSSTVDVDVVELTNDDIENIPITENKENIDDFDSKFILAIDVDKNVEHFNSLYPRICNVCHKIFKCKESFSYHKIYCKPAGVPKMRESMYPKRCDLCNQLLRNRQLAYAHMKKCGKPLSSREACLENTNVNGQQNEEISSSEGMNGLKCKRTSIYPRTCKYCGFVFNTKFAFHRHRKKCFGYANIGNTNADDSKLIKCSHCSQTFSNGLQHRQHMKYIHPQVKIKRITHSSFVAYPRTCSKCGKTYLSKQTFCNHKRKCSRFCATKLNTSTASNQKLSDFVEATSETEYDEADSINDLKINEQTVSDNGVEVIVVSNKKIAYPRVCTKCNRTYSNPQSFCNHKKHCPAASYETDDYISDDQRSPYDSSVAYPRECRHCQRTYASKQSFCNHKQHCNGYNKNSPITGHKSLYPRTCEFCERIYISKQSFHNHIKICPGPTYKQLDENRRSDSDLDYSDSADHSPQNQQNRSKNTHEKIQYPRMCKFCRKIYASRQTFHKHKFRCKPITPTTENPNTSGSPEQSFLYPRECENCFGTFKCAETFNAHKIRCDFFETRIEDEKTNILGQSNCEHCRNILQQYRRIFHQHLSQCDDPIITPHQKLLEARVSPELPLSSAENSQANRDSANPTPEIVNFKSDDCAINFCECCGVFFESTEQLEQHKRSVEMTHAVLNDVIVSDLSPSQEEIFTCDVCLEDFENRDDFEDHKLKCIVKTGSKIYPRFCECCKKIMKNKQVFYNHKKNCHIFCFKYFVQKECDICLTPFRCEKVYLQHRKTCVKFDNGEVAAECEVAEGTTDS